MEPLTKKRAVTTERRPAARELTPGQRALNELTDRQVEAVARGDWPYPNGSSFIPSDTPWAAKAIEESRRDGWHVVLCFPDGETQVIKAPLRRVLLYRFLMGLARYAHRGPYAVLYPR